MLNTLFNPRGSISGKPYWMACGVLIAAYWVIVCVGLYDAFVTQATYLPLSLNILFAALIYPYFCVYGKRLNELGFKRYWFIPILAAYIVMAPVGGYLLTTSIFGQNAMGLNTLFWSVTAHYMGATIITILFDLALGFARRPSTGFGGTAAV